MSVDLPGEKSTLEAEINKLKEQGHGPLDVSDRFSKAGLKNQYQSVYWVLCLHTHNNMSALEDRHIEKQGDAYKVVLFKEEDPKDLIRYFDTLSEVLIDSSTRIHRLLG